MRNTLSSAAAGDWREGDILSGIKRALALAQTLPPRAEFYSNSIYPSDSATKFARPSGAEAVVAHPDFWTKIPAASRAAGNPMFGIPIVDLDDDANRELRDTLNRELLARYEKQFGIV